MKNKYEEVKKILEKNNQIHLLSQYSKLNEEDKAYLLNQIININFQQLNLLYENARENKIEKDDTISPIEYIEKEKISEEEKNKYINIGKNEIKQGKLAVVTMAGGQGTRLRT